MSHQRVSPFGKGAQVVAQIGVLEALQGSFRVRHLTQHDVVEQSIIEHHHVLADQRNVFSQAVKLPFSDIDTVKEEGSFRGFNQAGDQMRL